MRRKFRPSCGLKAQLEKLTPEALNAFHRILGEQITYRQMIPRVEAELGVRTSEAALSNYYQTGRRGKWMARVGEQLTVSLSRFELLISCSPLGVVSIEVNELPPITAGTPEPEQRGTEQAEPGGGKG